MNSTTIIYQRDLLTEVVDDAVAHGLLTTEEGDSFRNQIALLDAPGAIDEMWAELERLGLLDSASWQQSPGS